MILLIVFATIGGHGESESGWSSSGEPNAPDFSAPSQATKEDPETSGHSENCGAISGKRAADFNNIRELCARVSKSGIIESAYADGKLVVLKVSSVSAHALMLTRLNTEQFLIDVMASWKVLTDSSRVTIRMEWKDVVIAEAKSTRLRGDDVTIKD